MSSSMMLRENAAHVQLPPELVKALQDGTAVVCQLHCLKATYDEHFGRNPVFPGDIIINNAAHALHEDVVVVKFDDPSTWRRRPADAKSTAATIASPATAAAASASGTGAAFAVSPGTPVPDGAAFEAARDEDGVPRHEDGRVIRDILKPSRGRDRAELAELLHARYVGGDNLETTNRRNMLGAQLRAKWAEDPLLQPVGKVAFVAWRRRPAERLLSCTMYVPANQSAPDTLQDRRWYRFKSYNQSLPFIAVYGKDVPKENRINANKYLFMVQLSDKLGTGYPEDADKSQWAEGRFPVGVALRAIGDAGAVDAESIAITATNAIRDAPFDDEVLGCIAESCPIPSKEELKKMGRRDLRESEFVTTIDPATARDLDDALSIEETPGGWRVGVHIADVSHFVPKDSAVDFEAQQRCTSTYLVERVIPMLPSKLCEDYCSLNAGVDKFAFSGLWDFDAKGNKTSEWFGQSLIRNRCRMAYEDAQKIIEGDESGDSLNFINETAPREELVKKVVNSVKMLYKLSNILRQGRTERGALALGKKKLGFLFEDMNSRFAPIGFKFEVQREANRLVEEFMLWANFRVAEKVVQFQSRVSLLRQHSPPVRKKLQRFVSQAQRHGYGAFSAGGRTGKTLREALATYKDDKNADVLSFLVVICMSLAKYCCSSQGMDDKTYEARGPGAGVDARLVGQAEAMLKNQSNIKRDTTREARHEAQADKDKVSLAHFALAAPFYCHFTSPIRRYADLITHRQLLLSLDIEKALASGIAEEDLKADDLAHGEYYYQEDEIVEITGRCNEKKEQAKKCGNMSISVYLSLFIEALRQKEQKRLLDEAVAAAAAAGTPPPTAIPDKKFFAVGVIVRTSPKAFTVHIRALAIEVEIYHNATNQLWQGENQVEEEGENAGDFSIDWGAAGGVEKDLSIFSELTGEIVTGKFNNNPVTQVYYVVLPPKYRTGLPESCFINKEMRI